MTMTKAKAKEKENDTRFPIALLSNCTATQSVPPASELQGQNLPEGLTTAEAVDAWLERMSKYKPTLSPSQLYRGISFHSIMKMQKFIHPNNIRIISIGQGLVPLKTPIIPYNLSIQPDNKNSLLKAITAEPFLPSYWWQLLNERLRESPWPITELLERPDLKAVFVACSAAFIQLITEDVANALNDIPSAQDKLRIITTTGSDKLPRHLEPYALRYDRRLNLQSAGNRNDLTQRAALHFLRLLASSPGLLDAPIEEQNGTIKAALNEIQPEGSVKIVGAKSYASCIEYLHELPKSSTPVMEATFYKFLKESGQHITSGQFRKAWYEVFGRKKHPKGKKVKKASMDAALAAMASIGDQLEKASSKIVNFSDEDDTIEILEIFVEALRSSNPTAKFASTEVVAWASRYADSSDTLLPAPLKSVAKLSRVLSTHYEAIGLEKIPMGNQPGANMYRLGAQTDDD